MSQPEQYYEQLQAIMSKLMGRLSWNDLCSELSDLDNPLSDQELTNNECGVDYMRGTTENRAWITSLVLMSWILRNFQKRAKEGYCQNLTHRHGVSIPRNCEQGRVFHREVFKRCLQSYQDVLNTFHDGHVSEPHAAESD
jgi:hypothetical protein